VLAINLSAQLIIAQESHTFQEYFVVSNRHTHPKQNEVSPWSPFHNRGFVRRESKSSQRHAARQPSNIERHDRWFTKAPQKNEI